MLARIVEILLDKYKVNILNDENDILVKTRGNVKKSTTLKVGDIVEVSKADNEYIITDIKERKNDYIRPPVSNVDYIYIIIAGGKPKPDYMLLDKQIITAVMNNTIPIIVVNKMDLDEAQEIAEYVKRTYEKLQYKIVLTSTINEELLNEKAFNDIQEGSICAFSGNSGVGKTSIISKIINGDIKLETNTVSNKTGKGRHTTKAVKLYTILNNQNKKIYFLDTPGFSSFDLYNLKADELKKYYPEFEKHVCDYDDCNHINEQEKYCAIKRAVKEDKIDALRYERYVKIYEELLEKEKRIYK